MKLTDITRGGVILRRPDYPLGELVLSIYSDDRLPYLTHPVGGMYFTRVTDGIGTVSAEDETADDWEIVKPDRRVVEASMAIYHARWVWDDLYVYQDYWGVLFRQDWAGSAITGPELCDELPDGGVWRPDITTQVRKPT